MVSQGYLLNLHGRGGGWGGRGCYAGLAAYFTCTAN